MKPERIATVANPLCEVALFMEGDGGAELVVGSRHEAVTRMKIAPPKKGRRITFTRNPDGTVEVEYRDA